MKTNNNGSVVVLGGGLAGIAAAWGAASQGERVTLVERARHLGGRAASIDQPGGLIDNGQHLFLGSCTQLQAFHDQFHLSPFFDRQVGVKFLWRGGKTSLFGAKQWLPKLFRFVPSLATFPGLTCRERFRLAAGMRRLLQTDRTGSPDEDETAGDFLDTCGASATVRERFWNPVALAALGDTVERVSRRALRKVLAEGLLDFGGPELFLPNRPLREIYHDALLPLLEKRGVQVRLGCRATRFFCDTAETTRKPDTPKISLAGVELSDGSTLTADRFILAFDWRACENILRASSLNRFADDLGFERFLPGAITAVHLWFSRRLPVPRAAVLTDGVGQWIFSPDPSAAGDPPPSQAKAKRDGVYCSHQKNWTGDASGIPLNARLPCTACGSPSQILYGAEYHQVLISGSHHLLTVEERAGRGNLVPMILEQLARLAVLPPEVTLLHAVVTTVPNAVFLPTPTLFSARRTPPNAPANLSVLGDWTDTGWPATLEGAVRSSNAGRCIPFASPSPFRRLVGRLCFRATDRVN